MSSGSEWLKTQLFQLKVYSSNGTAFEDLFTNLMKKVSPDFKKVKAHGSIGDKNNDGYFRESGEYYQCYGPEDIRSQSAKTNGAKKVRDDFKGVLENWNDTAAIQKFYFVVNDKYQGLNPEITQEIDALNNDYQSISVTSFTADDLEEIFQSLPPNKKDLIVGFSPSYDDIDFDADAFFEVAQYLNENFSVPDMGSFTLKYPNFDYKIVINNLCDNAKTLLTIGGYQCGNLEELFTQSGKKGLRKEFCERLIAIYEQSKELIPDDTKDCSSLRLVYVIEQQMPRREKRFFDTALTLTSYYFESCDIFEPVPSENLESQ